MTSVVKSVLPPGAPVSWNMPNRLLVEVLVAIVPDVDVEAEMPQPVVPVLGSLEYVSEEYLVSEAAGGVESRFVLSCNGGGLLGNCLRGAERNRSQQITSVLVASGRILCGLRYRGTGWE